MVELKIKLGNFLSEKQESNKERDKNNIGELVRTCSLRLVQCTSVHVKCVQLHMHAYMYSMCT